MAKLKPGEKRVQLSFQRPEDVALYAFLEKRAYESRHDIGTCILVSLQDWFKGQFGFEEPRLLVEVSGITPAPAPEPPPARPAAPPVTESADDGYEATKAAIAANAALYQKRKRVPKSILIPGADKAPAIPPASPE